MERRRGSEREEVQAGFCQTKAGQSVSSQTWGAGLAGSYQRANCYK